MSSYFLGSDLDRENAEDQRDARALAASSCRACGLTESLYASPFAVNETQQPSQLGPAPQPSCGANATAMRARVETPVVQSGMSESSSAYVAPDMVATGFGRYIPYTQVAAVNSGAWQFLPAFGGVRVAIPTSTVAGRGPAYARELASQVARAPARYGYLMQNDTLVPQQLGPGDRHLLAGVR